MNLRDASKNGSENFFGQALEKRFIWENCFCTTFTAVLSPPSIIPHHLKSVASTSSYYEFCDKYNSHSKSYLVTPILHLYFVVQHLLFKNDVWYHPSQVLWVSKISLYFREALPSVKLEKEKTTQLFLKFYRNATDDQCYAFPGEKKKLWIFRDIVTSLLVPIRRESRKCKDFNLKTFFRY